MTTGKKFLLLLRSGMGLDVEWQDKQGEWLPAIDSEDEWLLVMRLANEQTLQGILYEGVRRLPERYRPPRKIVLRSYMLGEKVSKLNVRCNEAAAKLYVQLSEAGFACCILKGQGNALAYPCPCARVPGDIDVWVAAPARSVIGYARRSLAKARACYHHVDYVKCDGVDVELHYRPAFLNNPIHNRRLQRWFAAEASAQCSHKVTLPGAAGDVSVPTDAFNRIFQMAHIVNHLIHEGIGMRQLMDYYFLLRRGLTDEERRRDALLLRRFGLHDIAAAVMYALQWLFALPQEQMIVAADKKRGVVLLKEVLEGGNFGRYAERSLKAHTQLDRNMGRLRRDWKLLAAFPSECLCEPLFRLWHFMWRVGHGNI